jgi:hypothetical protein
MEEPAVFEIVLNELQEEGYETLVHVPGSHQERYADILEAAGKHQIAIGGKYPDIVGFSPTDEVVAVEVKGSTGTERGIGQALTYQEGCHRVFLAADWDSVQSRYHHLSTHGIGILGVAEGRNEIAEWIDPGGIGSPPQLPDVKGELISQLRLGGGSRRIGKVALAQPLNFLAPVLAVENASESSVPRETVIDVLMAEYNQSRGTARYSIDGAQVLGFLSDSPCKLTAEGPLCTTLLAGDGVKTLADLMEYKSAVDTVVHESHPATATLLRNAYLRHPDIQILIEAIDRGNGAVRFIDLLRTLVTQYPNVFLNVFCTTQGRKDARDLIKKGDSQLIIDKRKYWESFLHSNIIQNFVQQLKHIGILTKSTPSHSRSLSEFDPNDITWELRSFGSNIL